MASVAAFLALAVLGALVSAGALKSIDTYAVHHLMPFGTGLSDNHTTLFSRLVAYSGDRFRAGTALRVPASLLPSAVLVTIFSAFLWRAGRRRLALFWLAALFLVDVAEWAGKHVIAKPQMTIVYHGVVTPVGFTHTYPSGHAARAAIVAAAAASVWRRLWPLFALWFVAVVVTAELDANHTPSDLLGGIFLAAGLIAAILAVEDPWPRRSATAAR